MFGILSRKSGFHQESLCHNSAKGESSWPEWSDGALGKKDECKCSLPLCLTLTNCNGKECTTYPCSNDQRWYLVFVWGDRKYFLIDDHGDLKLSTRFNAEALYIEVPKGDQVFTNDWSLGRYLSSWFISCGSNNSYKYSFVPFNSCSVDGMKHKSSSDHYRRFKNTGKKIPVVESCSSSSYDPSDVKYTSISGYDSDSSQGGGCLGKSLNNIIKIPLVGEKRRDPIYICPEGYQEINGKCIKPKKPCKPKKPNRPPEHCDEKESSSFWMWLLFIFLLLLLMVGLFYWLYRRNLQKNMVYVNEIAYSEPVNYYPVCAPDQTTTVNAIYPQ